MNNSMISSEFSKWPSPEATDLSEAVEEIVEDLQTTSTIEALQSRTGTRAAALLREQAIHRALRELVESTLPADKYSRYVETRYPIIVRRDDATPEDDYFVLAKQV